MTDYSFHKFNVLLDRKRSQQLEQLAQNEGTSKGAVLRRLIDRAAWMDLAGVPTCADGRRCFVPHMHGVSQQQTLPFTRAPESAYTGPDPDGDSE